MSLLNIVKEKSIQAIYVSADALRSRTYLYPPLGTIYFATHSTLWPPLLHRLLPCTALSIGIIVPMFFFTYLPQAAVLTVFNGPFGFVNAVGLVLSESAVIINTLSRAFLLEGALVDVFDATLVSEGQESLVSRGREVKPGSKLDGTKKLGKLLTKPLNRFSPRGITEYLTMLPLNLIPVIGTGIFLILQGRRIGPIFHSRYFQLKGFDEEKRRGFIERNKGSYLAFGTASMILSLIPLASIVFTFTTTIGGALWAAEIEKGNVRVPGDAVDTMGRDSELDSETYAGESRESRKEL